MDEKIRHITTPEWNKHNDYVRVMQVRALDMATDSQDRIIEGKAIVFDEKTKLFTIDGVDYYEIIERNALAEADLRDVFVKYNHSDHQMVVARSKNGTLQIDIRDDGVWVKIRLANTTGGHDLYELVRRGDIDKMSFAFSLDSDKGDEVYDPKTHTWTVKRIRKVWEVSAVPFPAYEATTLYARRAGEVESRLAEVEASQRKATALYILSKI